MPTLNWELRLWSLTLVQPHRKAAVLLTDKICSVRPWPRLLTVVDLSFQICKAIGLGQHSHKSLPDSKRYLSFLSQGPFAHWTPSGSNPQPAPPAPGGSWSSSALPASRAPARDFNARESARLGPEGHLLHHGFYLHPESHVHEKCVRVRPRLQTQMKFCAEPDAR